MALLPEFFIDCVVAIGIAAGGDGSKDWVATGFLYGDYIGQSPSGKNYYEVFLATNRHVFEGLKTVYLRFNPEAGGPAREYVLPLQDSLGMPVWFAHPDPEVDVAVTNINIDLLSKQQIDFSYFPSNTRIADRAKMIELGLTEGDGVYVLGFPMRLVGKERNFVIVRQGSIARIRDALGGVSKEFLVDAFVFPGNSGGPVVSIPTEVAIQGTKSQSSAYLIGMVKGYVPYQEIAISPQTGRPRIIFEENSGLAAVVPIDFVKETVQYAKSLREKAKNR